MLRSFNLLEYFDEAGNFHRSPWDASDGFVARSADYDPRNKEKPLSYTSLIVDAVHNEADARSIAQSPAKELQP